MENSLSPELFWLLMVVALTGLLWVPYIIRLIAQLGPLPALWDPFAGHPHEAKWAERAKRAHYNAVENLAVFAPLVLMIEYLGLGTGLTALVAMIYFIARLVHYLVYLFAVPVIRTLAFMVGFGCQAILALHIFSII